jgi:cytochrome c biogenesis protein CcmG/thiol:disulfide interchange protein DsbE
MVKNKSLIIVAILSILLVAILAWLFWSTHSVKTSNRPIKDLKAFSVTTFYPAGKTLSSEVLAGQYYMVNFMASWCGYCIEEITTLSDIKNIFPIPLIGVIVADSDENINLLFNQIPNPFDYLVHNNVSLATNFGNHSLPQTIIVNDRGQVVFKHVGVITKDQFKNIIIPFIKANKK